MNLRIYLKFILTVTQKSISDNIYLDCNGNIFSILKSSLQESLVPAFITILIILSCILKILLLHEEFPQNVKP
jgi:hypothetical protein